MTGNPVDLRKNSSTLGRVMRLKAQLLHVADAYAVATGASDGAISHLLFGNGNRLGDLRAGSDMRSGGVEDAIRKLSDHWPDGAAWPPRVARPVSIPCPIPSPIPRPAA